MSVSSQQHYLDCNYANNFVDKLNSLVSSAKFIFHFDDIGSLESVNNGSTVVTFMIYRLWIIADKLRENGNFFAITGRSEILRGIGSSTRLKNIDSMIYIGDYTSPDVMKQIPVEKFDI